ncbi:unnamed protein product, partial [Strongylus vulgaris]
MDGDDELVDCELLIASPTSDAEIHYLTDSSSSSEKDSELLQNTDVKLCTSFVSVEKKIDLEVGHSDERANRRPANSATTDESLGAEELGEEEVNEAADSVLALFTESDVKSGALPVPLQK